MMPFFDTPNPGGVYKAWMIPLERYYSNAGFPGKGTKNSLIAPPAELKAGRGPAAVKVGYQRDPGFGPPRDQVKTDNFKVKEESTGILTVLKFHDLNANGVWDEGEPAIGPTEGGAFQCVADLGVLSETCGGEFGGWPVTISEASPVVINDFFTPVLLGALAADDYTVSEGGLANWILSAATVDGVDQGAVSTVTVTVTGEPFDNHEVVFGNYLLASINGVKFEDRDGNGARDAGEPGLAGVTIQLLDGCLDPPQPTPRGPSPSTCRRP